MSMHGYVILAHHACGRHGSCCWGNKRTNWDALYVNLEAIGLTEDVYGEARAGDPWKWFALHELYYHHGAKPITQASRFVSEAHAERTIERLRDFGFSDRMIYIHDAEEWVKS